MATTGGFDLVFLAPDYLGDVPSNPTDGPAPFLLDLNGNSSGIAAIAGIKVSGNRSVSICNEISRLGGGPNSAQLRLNANLSLPIGCLDRKSTRLNSSH